VNHKLVRPTEEDFGGQVPTHFAAEGALSGDGLKRKFLPTGGNNSAASFARDDEALPISGHLEHASIIGEKMARTW